MLPKFLVSTALVSIAAGVFTGCAASSVDEAAFDAAESELIGGRVGAVFTLNNDAVSNDVVVYRRAANGSLQRAASYATTGQGSGDGLGSQGSLVLSQDRRWLFAVSAGSNELSVFQVQGENLALVDTIATGGIRPVSVTEHAGLVYVAHAGEANNNITGFSQRRDGTLAPLPGSTHALSAATVGPAQIAFSPSGRALVVTEKMTNKIVEFRIDASGTPASMTVHESVGRTPFGFAMTQRGQVIVSEAFGGDADASKVSSYQLGRQAGLTNISASVPTTESAACWVALAKRDSFAYVSNTASGSISAYTVGADGKVALVGVDGRAADTGAGSKPIEMATSRDDGFLYVVEGGTSTIGVIRIERNGTLTVLPDVAGIAKTTVGIAAL
jgi:6-phosphogluconolactonase